MLYPLREADDILDSHGIIQYVSEIKENCN